MVDKTWTEKVDSDETNGFLSCLAEMHLQRAHAAAQTVWETEQVSLVTGFVGCNDYRSLVLYRLDIHRVTNAEFLYHLSQVLAFYSKREDLEIGIDTQRVAETSSLKAEHLCSVTNDLFRMRAEGDLTFPPRVERVLSRAKQKIASILGPVPKLADLQLRFGPGATTLVKKREANARKKLAEGFQCTRELVPYLTEVGTELPCWIKSQPGLKATIDTSIFSFVNKNAKTKRAIAVEPVVNSLVQLGIGDYIAALLRRAGVDIRDQELNQELARLGSIDGWLATIDLSSASDTIAALLVLELLPYDWYHLLDTYRSHTAMFRGKEMRLSKFSSMGNGFTFPLETLIFYALSWATWVEERDGLHAPIAPYFQDHVRAYGDDIIVPCYCTDLLFEVLRCVGFVPNQDKSFVTGPFRESCGKDYYLGVDTRPWFARDQLSLASVFSLVNYYTRRGEIELASIAASVIPDPLLLEGPDGYGDGHLVSDRPLKAHGRDRGFSGYIFRTLKFTPRREDFGIEYGTDSAYAAYIAYRSSQTEHVVDATINARVFAGGYLRRRTTKLRSVESVPHPVGIDGSFAAPLPGTTGDMWDHSIDYSCVRVYTLTQTLH